MLATVHFGVARAGLETVGYKILAADKTSYASRTTTGVTELADGIYGVTVADSDLAGRTIVWDTGGDDPVYATETFGGLDTLRSVQTKTNYLPSATAGSAGGVLIAGENAPTTFKATQDYEAALSIISENGNGLIIEAQGGGDGHGEPGWGVLVGSAGSSALVFEGKQYGVTFYAQEDAAVFFQGPTGMVIAADQTPLIIAGGQEYEGEVPPLILMESADNGPFFQAEILDAIAAAVRDVDNTSPAEDSLGEAVNNAGGGGGGSGEADWSAAEKKQIRSALGVDGDKEAATGGQLQTMAGTVSTNLDAKVSTRSVFAPASDTVKLAVNQDVRNVTGTLPAVTLAATQGSYAPAKAGDKMDLIDAPNATALGAIKDAVQGVGTTLATLLSRIVGTLDSGTHKPQSGDAYAVVSDATHGNAKLAKPGDIPSAATVAGQVRTELTTELGRIDAQVSTRLAADAYTAPPSTSDIKTAMEAAGSHLALILEDTGTTIPDALEALNDLDGAAVEAAVAAALAAYDAVKASQLPGEPPTAAAITTAVWSALERTLTQEVETTVDEEAIAAAVALALSGREIAVVSPLAETGTLTLIRGDDYVAAEGRGIGFGIPDPLHRLDLDGKDAEVRLKAAGVMWTATEVSQTEAGYAVMFEPTAEETAQLTHSGLYEVEATTGGGHNVTLVIGALTVRRDIPAVPPDQP